MRFRFTLSHNESASSQEISEPDGVQGSKLVLQRDADYMSLSEGLNGSANSAFIFYGNDGDKDGGINFLKEIEQGYGFDANIDYLEEFAPDDISYIEVFSGLADLSAKNEMPDNKMQVPIIRDDFWTRFFTRRSTPVNLSDTVDLDGNPVDPVTPVTINLPSQPIRKVHYSFESEQGVTVTGVDNNEYIQFTPGKFELDEMKDFYTLTPINQTELPSPTFDVFEEGTYNFDIRWTISVINGATENHANSLDVFIQFNNDTPIALTRIDQTNSTIDSTKFTFSGSYYLLVGDSVRIYCVQDSVSTLNWGFWGANGLINGTTYNQPRPNGMDAVPTYTRVTADTVTPATQAECYFIHDLIYGVLQRIGLGNNPFYSEFLGATFTNCVQYDEDGCGSMYVIAKGLQIRQYTLTEKPFFISFDEIWNGINPILNLGLGYEAISDDSPEHQVIRIEQSSHFLSDDISINFSNVRDISSSYDKEFIFKTIKTGYKKWQADDISGIDDFAKQTRATRFEKVGRDLNLESDFIAAGLTIETTRRTSRIKSADFKYDNDNFIIAINTDDVSPDTYGPELNEYFNSVTGILHSDNRYNLILSPLRNFLRWTNIIGGCLQMYTTSSYKFVSGEGNYTMTTDYSCVGGNQCQAILCDSISENDDIPLGLPSNYNNVFGYLFLPIVYSMTIPMEWEDYDTIRNNRKKSIGISQTTSGHIPFKIKLLEYDRFKGEATIQAWPKTFLDIQVIDQQFTMQCDVEPDVNNFDECYQEILDYAETI